MGWTAWTRDYWASRRSFAHRFFWAREIAARALADSFRRRRFPGSVPIGTTGCRERARSPALRGAGKLIQQASFRHSFAVTYIRNGGDIYRLSRILGHTQASTTSYIAFNGSI